MAGETDSWKDDIRKKLVELYGDESSTSDPEGLVILLLLLDNSDAEYATQAPGIISPFWRTLRTAYKLNANTVLKHYADRMINDAKECKKDPKFLAAIAKIYDNMADPNDAEFEETLSVFKDVALCPLTEHRGSAIGVGTGLARVWDAMTPATKAEVVAVIKTIATNYRALSCVDECVSLVNKAGGTIVMVGLAAVSITWQCWVNLRRWKNGEISGKRCSKNCVDSLVEVGSGFGGGLAGAVVGSMIMPGVGTFIGGIVGGLTAGAVAKVLADRLTMWIFDLPQDEAVEKAYQFLEVHHKASNDVINKAFRSKALKFHPDKGGKAEDFYQLQMQMALIKMARGEVV